MKKPEPSQKHRPEDDAVGFEYASYLVDIFSKYLFAGLDKYDKA